MKQMLKRLVTLTLAMIMALSVWPMGGDAQAVGAYGRTTSNGVRVRKQPSTDAAYWFKIDADYVCELLDVTVKGDVTWYKVNVEHPDPVSTRTYIGYIHGDYFALLSESEAAQYELTGTLGTGTVVPTAAPTAAPGMPAPTAAPTQIGGNTVAYAGATGQITNGGVNFRVSEGGDVICKLDRGTVVEILTIPPVIDENHWYMIRYDGHVGYVMATFLRVVSIGDPNGVPSDPSVDVSTNGYVRLILSSANLRLTPGGDVGAQWENTGEVLAIVGIPVESRGYMWYPVEYGGVQYYVREDTVQLQATPGGAVVGGTTPTQAPVGTVVGYVRTTAAGVNLRLQPAGEAILQVKRNVVLPMLAPVVTEGGYAWYYVETADNVRGYLRGDCVVVCNADGSDVSGGAPVATQTPSATIYGYVITTMDKVNLRTKPTGSSQEQIALNVILPMTGPKIRSGIYDWYPVKAASGNLGYVRGDCVRECNADGSDVLATPTPAPGATAAPTVAPGATAAPNVSAYGYVMITQTSVNLRRTAGGSKIGTLEKNSVWPMTGNTVSEKGYTWYPVSVNGLQGFVRGDCCFKLSATQQQSYLAGLGVPEEAPAPQVNYVITTVDKVNLRAAATKDSQAKFNVPLNTVMAYKSTATVGGSLWYKVIYSNTEVWVLGSCVRQMTAAEYNQWQQSNPQATPQPDVIAGYVKTTMADVNLRRTAGGSVIARLPKDAVYPYTKTETAKGYTWYYVKTDLGYGYLRGDCIMPCNADGSPLITPTTGPSGGGQEASYTTLRRGSSGTAVRNLVQELINQGYYHGEVTSNYTSAVEAAVRAFQQAKGLEVDGIAGSATQHALFGTVPIGSGDTSDLSITLYPAEKIDWFTGGIQQLWPKGANNKIYDVKTGIVWWAHRWSGGYHADIEPLTAADTARLCRIYGVSDAQEISDKNMWERRPCLVTIGTRTFACSLDGMPHNPDGDTIPNNNMVGQICLHFTNSKGHESGAVSSTHQEAIEYAWLHAPNGHK